VVWAPSTGRAFLGGVRSLSYGMRLRVTLLALAAARLGAQPAPASPPPVDREFRAIWLTTVGNTDWPSKPGLSTWDQQRELLTILDRAVSLNLNAIILQVRPGADAFYASPYEPWSQFLTGRQGRAPEPPWDPLAFAVEQAHKRGLELHAWFNPYRAAYTRDTAIARTHISQTNPALVWPYDRFVWMDPGIAEVRRRSVRAIVDVARRYDVDGVHIDDYFYPYPVTDRSGQKVDFPDSATYARYVKNGGALPKDDWRRDNVDKLVEALYTGVHAVKPWVKVGISPFGIWRPGNPPGITGFDAYAEIYADSKKWMQKGWGDYFAPQLYWAIAGAQSFPALYDWWTQANTKHRHIWPGLAAYRVSDTTSRRLSSQEIVAQIDTMRARGADLGHILFNTKALMNNPEGLTDKLRASYTTPALVPASPWLGATPPGKPVIALGRDAATNERSLKLTPAKGEKPWLWSVRTSADGVWTTEILPGWVRVHRLTADRVERVYVTAVSRTGVESPAAMVAATSAADAGQSSFTASATPPPP
jgi:uncharacterized lipoprotein YddW (UPF0748 family)